MNEIAAMIGGEVEHIYPNPRGEFEELRKSADNSRAKEMIGWEPQVSPSDGIRAIASGEEAML